MLKVSLDSRSSIGCFKHLRFIIQKNVKIDDYITHRIGTEWAIGGSPPKSNVIRIYHQSLKEKFIKW